MKPDACYCHNWRLKNLQHKATLINSQLHKYGRGRPLPVEWPSAVPARLTTRNVLHAAFPRAFKQI